MANSVDVQVTIEGFVEPGFEPVREALKDMLSTGREAAAQVCVSLEGRLVVDLCGKVALPSRSTSWLNSAANRDVLNKYDINSMTLVSSSSKVMVALAMALLVDRKLLSYDICLANIWPEFAAKGKENVTVADVLQFEAGLAKVQVNKYLDLKDFSRASIKKGKVSDMLEEQELEPGSVDPDGFKRRCYHAFTQGYLLNEVCRRVDPRGRTIGELLDQDIFKPLGIDACIGAEDDGEEQAIEGQAGPEGAVSAGIVSPGFKGRMISPLIPPLLKMSGSIALPKWLRSAHEKEECPCMTDVVQMMIDMVKGYTTLVVLPRKAQGKLTLQDQFPVSLSGGTISPMRIPPEASQTTIIPWIPGMGYQGPVDFKPWRIKQFFTHKDFWTGEHPGVNGFGTAKGLAYVASILANKGVAMDGKRVLKETTWELMHSGDKVSPDMGMGGIRTQLSQGGPNNFLEYVDDAQVEKRFKACRLGFRGWLGIGGSVLQYHPELKIGFGYAPLKFSLLDPYSSCGGRLQEEVVKCLWATKKIGGAGGIRNTSSSQDVGLRIYGKASETM